MSYIFQEGQVAERICKQIETSIKSPHLPLQVGSFIFKKYRRWCIDNLNKHIVQSMITN